GPRTIAPRAAPAPPEEIMIQLLEGYARPVVFLIAGWSLRWALVIGLLAVGLAWWRPRSAGTSFLCCRLALTGGLLLPFLPRYWGPTAPLRESFLAANSLTSPVLAVTSAQTKPFEDELASRRAVPPHSTRVSLISVVEKGDPIPITEAATPTAETA